MRALVRAGVPSRAASCARACVRACVRAWVRLCVNRSGQCGFEWNLRCHGIALQKDEPLNVAETHGQVADEQARPLRTANRDDEGLWDLEALLATMQFVPNTAPTPHLPSSHSTVWHSRRGWLPAG
jgi:hypothetical protein